MRHIVMFPFVLAACASPGPRETETPPVSEPAPTEVAPEPTSEPAPVAPPRVDASPKPVPPLSTPNQRVDASAPDAAAAAEEPGVPHADPRLTALRRAGEAAQACYDQSGLPPNTAGKLFVRIQLAKDGSVARAEVVRAESAPALVGGKLESCVLAAVRKQSFPAPRSGADVLIDMPLEFSPVQQR